MTSLLFETNWNASKYVESILRVRNLCTLQIKEKEIVLTVFLFFFFLIDNGFSLMVKILFTRVLKFWLFGAFSWHWVDFVSNYTVGLFLETKLAQFPLRPRCNQQKKRSLNSVPDLAAR